MTQWENEQHNKPQMVQNVTMVTVPKNYSLNTVFLRQPQFLSFYDLCGV